MTVSTVLSFWVSAPAEVLSPKDGVSICLRNDALTYEITRH
jgi:hypothetical protein